MALNNQKANFLLAFFLTSLKVSKQLGLSDSSEHLESELQVGFLILNSSVINPIHAKVLDKHFSDLSKNLLKGFYLIRVVFKSEKKGSELVKSLDSDLVLTDVVNKIFQVQTLIFEHRLEIGKRNVRVAEVTDGLAKVLDQILCFSCVVGLDSDASRRAFSSELWLLGAFLATFFRRRSAKVKQARNLGDLRLFESF